jgi:hypothetical protein
MTRIAPSSAATLPPVVLTPEQAAAIAVALAAQPDGPYAADGRAALEIVVAALEPDPDRRAALLAGTRRVSQESRQTGRRIRWDRVVDVEATSERASGGDAATVGAPPAGRHPTHPAGRALRGSAAERRPRLVLLPGGRQE